MRVGAGKTTQVGAIAGAYARDKERHRLGGGWLPATPCGRIRFEHEKRDRWDHDRDERQFELPHYRLLLGWQYRCRILSEPPVLG